MSGGSYDYLCNRDSSDIDERVTDLERMADRLAELMQRIRQYQVHTDVIIARLVKVWKAVEWWDSGDWSEDAVRKALGDYRGGGQS